MGRGHWGDSDEQRANRQARSLQEANRLGLRPMLARREVTASRDRARDQRDTEEGGLRVPPLQLLEHLDGGEPVVVVAGEALARADDEDAAALLADRGFEPVEERRERSGSERAGAEGLGVVRHIGPEDELFELLRAASEKDVGVGANHLLALRGRMKQGDTPELTAHPPAPRQRSLEVNRSVPVAVVDTGYWDTTRPDHGVAGVAAGPRTDGWLQHVHVGGAAVDHVPGLSTADPSKLDPGAGHGTFVCAIIEQAYPQARIGAFRGLTTMGVGTEDDVADAILRAGRWIQEAGDGLGVMNLSLGTTTIDDRPPVAIEAALERLPSSVLVVASAGNEDIDQPVFPAAMRRVQAVGSLRRDGITGSAWCTRGEWVDFSTVGEGVVGPFVAGPESVHVDPNPETFPSPGKAGPYALWTGTSFSAPQVAAWLARYLTECDPDPGAAVRWLAAHGPHEAGRGHKLHPATMAAAGCRDAAS